MTKTRHLVWDWNGTLLSDAEIVLRACNETFAEFDAANPPPAGTPRFTPFTASTYEAAFVRPIQQFYAATFGREISAADFVELEESFQAKYVALLAGCSLAGDAHEALNGWRAGGGTQSLLSLWSHAQLVRYVARFGLTEYFHRIDGRRVPDVTSKAEPLREHLAALTSTREVVLIGDALDDAAAAAEVGARCIMYAGGTHDVSRLAKTGNPVAHTLTEAIALAAAG